LKDFGFDLIEKRNYSSYGCLAVEKRKDFDVKDLLKEQHIKRGKLWEIRNLLHPKF
jgi:hypothetical protein